MSDSFMGGNTVQIDPTQATPAQLAKLAGGGITGGRQPQPKTELVHKYAAPINSGVAPQRQAPSVNRNLAIAGYKGKADAWIRCLKEFLHVNGGQVDRKFYLSLDPREAHRQAELMEVGTQAFSTFVVWTYRDALPDPTPIGLPAARNLHSFVGRVMEEGRNVGPILIVLPFHTLMPGSIDIIERHFTHATGTKGINFLGYEIKKPEGRTPGGAIVLPPLWARHPDYPLAKGLNQYTPGDISYIKDEVLREMRVSDVMVGHGNKVGAMTVLQTFPQDEIMDIPKGPAFNPAGRPQPPVGQPAQTRPPEPTLAERAQELKQYNESVAAAQPVNPPARSFSAEEKEAALALISQLGMGALKVLDAARYGLTLAEDEEFANQAQNKAQGFKIRQGKQAKAK